MRKLCQQEKTRPIPGLRSLAVFFILFLGVFCFSRDALGATVTWNGGGTTNNWSEGANWSSGSPPGSGDDVVFSSAGLKDSVWDSSHGGTVLSLTVNSSYTGTLSLGRDVAVFRGWTYDGSNFNAGSYTLKLVVSSVSYTFNPGSVNYYNLEIAGSNSLYYTLTVSGTASVLNNYIFTSGERLTLNGGTINVFGDFISNSNISAGSVTHGFLGSGDQTIIINYGSLGNVIIDKPSGNLIFGTDVVVSKNWNWVKGKLNPNGKTIKHTVSTANPTSWTFTPGDVDYYNLEIAGSSVLNSELVFLDTTNVLNDFKITSGTRTRINGSIINVHGNFISNTDVANGGTVVYKFIGKKDQEVIVSSGGFYGIEIDKPSGKLIVKGDLTVERNWIWTRGWVDMGTSKITFKGYGGQTFVPGDVRYYDIWISKADSNALFLGGDLIVSNELRVTNQQFSTTSSNFSITTKNFVQTGGTVTLNSSVMKILGNFTRSGGTFNSNTSTVAFQGINQAINVTGYPTTFYRLYKLTNEADTFTIAAGNNITIASGGIMRLWGKPEGRILSLRSSTPGSSYTITRTGSVEAEYCDFQDANFSAATVAAASNSTSGNTNLTVTKEFISTIRASGGDYTTLSAWEAAFGTIDLTSIATKVFSHGGITGIIPDNSSVTGGTSGATATAVHVTGTQILLKSISGAFQSGEQVRLDGSNYVTITDAGFGAIVTAHPYNDWPNGLDDMVLIAGFTSDSNRNVRIYVPLDQRHRGTLDSGGFFIKSSSGSSYIYNIEIWSRYTLVDGVKIERTSSNWPYGTAIKIGGLGHIIKNCLLYQSSGGGTGGTNNSLMDLSASHYYDPATGSRIFNNTIISDSLLLERGMVISKAFDTNSSNTNKIFNNTVYGKFDIAGIHLRSDDSVDQFKFILRNNYVLATSGAGFVFVNQYNNSLANFSNNFSSDGTAGSLNGNGTIPASDAKFISTETGLQNLHIHRDSGLKNKGVDLSADAVAPFIDDIDGESRLGLDPDAWDIGADQFYPTTKAELGGGSGVPGASPVGHWKFDEGFGDTAHNSGSAGVALNGTLNSGGSGGNATNTAMWDKNGKFGGAMEFDGVNDYVAISNFQLPTSNQFSISKFVKFSTLQTAKPIISQWGGNQNNILIKTDDTNSDELRVCIASGLTDNCANYGYTTDADLSAGTWHNVQIVYDGSGGSNEAKLKLYLNGIPKTLSYSGTIPTTIQNTATSVLQFGGNSSLSTYVSALLDDVKIFDYALSADQVKLEHNGGAAVRMGSLGADPVTGKPSNSASSEYCVPGSTDYCAGPVGEWKMDEKVSGSGKTVYDTSGNGNHGTTNWGSNASGMDCSKPGKYGTGCDFDGVDDYASFGDIFYSDIFSVCAWVKESSTKSYSNVVLKRNYAGGVSAGDNEWELSIKNGFPGFYSWKFGESTLSVSSGTAIMAGKWNHICGVQKGDGASGYIYVNGDEQGNAIQTGVMDNTNMIIQIGARSADNNARYFNGLIDQVRIYDYARTPAQIAWEYNQGKPIAHWKMDETSGNTVHNYACRDATSCVSTNGTRQNMEDEDWKAGKFGNGLEFDGTNEYVSVGNTGLSINAVSFWIKAGQATDEIIDLDGGTRTITVSSGNIAAGGFSSPTIYVDGKESSTITTGNWHHILVKTNTAFSVSSFNIGKIGSGYFQGTLDDIRFYNYSPTAEQVKQIMNEGAGVRF